MFIYDRYEGFDCYVGYLITRDIIIYPHIQRGVNFVEVWLQQGVILDSNTDVIN